MRKKKTTLNNEIRKANFHAMLLCIQKHQRENRNYSLEKLLRQYKIFSFPKSSIPDLTELDITLEVSAQLYQSLVLDYRKKILDKSDESVSDGENKGVEVFPEYDTKEESKPLNSEVRIERLEKIQNLQQSLLEQLLKKNEINDQIVDILIKLGCMKVSSPNQIKKKRIPKIGEMYAIPNVLSTPGLRRAILGKVIEVMEDKDCYVVIANYGLKSGNQEHIFTDVIFKDEINPIS